MRYFLFSDVHANLEALIACLEDYVINFQAAKKTKENIALAFLSQGFLLSDDFRLAKTREKDKVICLGDILGYGANPRECFEIVDFISQEIVLGNHEVYLCREDLRLSFKEELRAMWEWTLKELGEKNKKKLERLYRRKKSLLQEEKLCFSHGVPLEKNFSFSYFSDTDALKEFFSKTAYQRKICFMGHSHQPAIIEGTRLSSGEIFWKIISIRVPLTKQGRPFTQVFSTKNTSRLLISIPSVGQPRDFLKETGYVVYDSEKEKVFFRRIPYNIGEAVEKIKEAGLSFYFAQRLWQGR